jgi:hypothetical protein
VFRSELPPGFELVVTSKDHIIPVCCVNAYIEKTVNHFATEHKEDFWEPHNTGCTECDEKGISCDCRLPFDVLNNIIHNDKEFIKKLDWDRQNK